MKRLTSFLLTLLLLFSLTACGGEGDSDDPNVGVWNAVSGSMMGISMDVSSVFAGGVTLELKANGKFELNADGTKGNGKWAYDGDNIKFTSSDADMTGTIQNGMLILQDLLGMGMDITFEKEGGYAGAQSPAASGGDAGFYVLESGMEDGEVIAGDELRALGLDYYVVLGEDGTAIFKTDNTVTGTWKNGVMTLVADGETDDLPYTLEGNELTIDIDGLVMVFVRSDDQPPSAPRSSISTSGPLADGMEWWAGDWYGYWEAYSASDLYEHLEDEGYMDCYAEIYVNADGSAMIYLQDDLDTLADVEVEISESGGKGAMGAAVSVGGHFIDAPVGRADWIIDPSLYGYDNYLVIDGTYEDPLYPDEGFQYNFYLRPWGQLWDGIPEDDRPPYYDWYLDVCNQSMQDALLELDSWDGTDNSGDGGETAPVASGNGLVAPGTVVIDYEGIIVTYLGLQKDGDDKHTQLAFEIENNQDRKVILRSFDFTINGVEDVANLWTAVEPGESAIDCLTVKSSDIVEAGFDPKETVIITSSIYIEGNSFNKIFESEIYSFEFNIL